MTANRCRKHHLPMADMNLPVNDRLDAIHRSRKGQARRRPDVASFTYRDRGRAPRWLPPTRTRLPCRRLVRRGGEWTGTRIIDQCGTQAGRARADAFTRRSPTTGDARPLNDLIE